MQRAEGAPFMKAANTKSSAPGGIRALAPSSVDAIHVETSARELRLVLSGLMLALTLAALDQNIVATALPRITGEFGGLQHLSWVVTSFIVASTVSAPLYGKLSDLYGRKPAFIASISIFLIGSALCGFAGSMGALIAFRAVQGLGAGGLIVLAQTVIGDLVSPRERGRYQGMFAAVFAACSVAGPLLGGIITEYASWRWIFYVNLPVGGAALAFIAIGLRPKAPGVRAPAGPYGSRPADHRRLQPPAGAELGRRRLCLVFIARAGTGRRRCRVIHGSGVRGATGSPADPAS